DVGHLGEVRALAAEQVLHLLRAFSLAAAEEVRALARLLQDRRLGADLDPVLGTVLVAVLERDLLRFQGLGLRLGEAWHGRSYTLLAPAKEGHFLTRAGFQTAG